ncbi:OadG family protein [Pseudohalioglobus lutimaris]|uniref:Probable oxaloacetate decarboxylase gamma chain n=1 Tax=Pseudohalioglobus lutimaris TaxID=1737061 RepID=A0A2N5X5H8_9GAMM|nr:OadG family transporter subunit [Pseudohalioglobus lutimaris]PLW69742.1 oxaloacetate decarboxylase [Pseudohalioglobus lutimaris]
MQGNIMAQGVELMIYGMGTVVVFLALLVVATTAMSAFVGRFFAEVQQLPRVRPVPARALETDDPELVAVISAAIHRHRQEK